MLERVFEMFTQVDHSRENAHAGLGIGLTLVKSLVVLHGGTIEAHSDGIGQGSAFTIRLPILGTGSFEQKSPPLEKDVFRETKPKCRVLVVDDNRVAADMLSTLVEMLGNDVRTVYGGQEAIEAAGDFRPDLVLLDLGMPRMNGYEAARCIRQQPWGSQMMLVALTGWGQNEDKQRTQSAGFDRHLVKPADLSVLKQLLAELESKRT